MSRTCKFAAQAALGFLTGLIMQATAQAQEIELKASHYLPPNHTFQKALTAWGEELEKSSGGKLKLRIYPASQLGPVNRQFELARNGVADIAVVLHGATPGRFPMSELVSGPYVTPSAGVASAVTSRRLTELAPEYLVGEHEGTRILWMAVTPPLMFHSIKPITKLEDFKGLRVRYAGTNFKSIIDALGAVPLAVSPAETQDALSKGIIDAATFPYEGAASFDLGTIAKFTLEPGISSATFAVVMNSARYDGLPADLKTLIDQTTGAARAEWYGRMWDASEKEGKASLAAKGMATNTLSSDELKRIMAIVVPLNAAAIADTEKKGLRAKAFFDAYTK